jgi:hypothetical protein
LTCRPSPASIGELCVHSEGMPVLAAMAAKQTLGCEPYRFVLIWWVLRGNQYIDVATIPRANRRLWFLLHTCLCSRLRSPALEIRLSTSSARRSLSAISSSGMERRNCIV